MFYNTVTIEGAHLERLTWQDVDHAKSTRFSNPVKQLTHLKTEIAKWIFKNPGDEDSFTKELTKTKRTFTIEPQTRYEYCLQNSRTNRGFVNKGIVNLLCMERFFVDEFKKFADRHWIKHKQFDANNAIVGDIPPTIYAKIEENEEIFGIFRMFFVLTILENGTTFGIRELDHKKLEKLALLSDHPSEEVQTLVKTINAVHAKRERENKTIIEDTKLHKKVNLLLNYLKQNNEDAKVFDTRLIYVNLTPTLKYLLSAYIDICNITIENNYLKKMLDFSELYESNREAQRNLYSYVFQDFNTHKPTNGKQREFLSYRKSEEWLHSVFDMLSLPNPISFFGEKNEKTDETTTSLSLSSPETLNTKHRVKKTKKKRSRNNKRKTNESEVAPPSKELTPELTQKRKVFSITPVFIDNTSWLTSPLNIKLDPRVRRWQAIRFQSDIPNTPEFSDYSSMDESRRKNQKIKHSLHIKLFQILNLSTHVFRDKDNYFAIVKMIYPDASSELGVLEFGLTKQMNDTKRCHHFYFSKRHFSELLSSDPAAFSHFEEAINEEASSDISDGEIVDERDTISIIYDNFFDTYRFQDKVLDTTVVVFPIKA